MENQTNDNTIMDNQEKKEHTSWYIFIGCMFIGMGIGMAFDQDGVGLLVGMGAGFIASALYTSEKK